MWKKPPEVKRASKQEGKNRSKLWKKKFFFFLGYSLLLRILKLFPLRYRHLDFHRSPLIADDVVPRKTEERRGCSYPASKRCQEK